MNPTENSNSPPEFGTPDPQHLIAPSQRQSYHDYQGHHWDHLSHDVNGHQGYDQQGGSYSLQPPAYLQDNFFPIFQGIPFYNAQEVTWNQGHQNPSLSYNTDEMINEFAHGLQVPSESRDRQPSSPGNIASTSAALSTFNLNRPRLSEAELASRSEKLNQFDWQKVYHEDELLNIYWKIFSEWGPQKRATATLSLFPRLNKYFKDHPDQAEYVFANDENVIESVGINMRRFWYKNYQDTDTGIMTPQELLLWVISRANAHVRNNDNYVVPSWVPHDIKDRRLVSKMYNRLVKAWKMDEKEVDVILQSVTSNEVEPFLHDLKGRDVKVAERGALALLHYIRSRGNVSQGTMPFTSYHNSFGHDHSQAPFYGSSSDH